MDSCCKNTYDYTFDLKRARKEIDQYLKKGPKKTTKNLLDPLQERIQIEDSLLDIGGGVGALILDLMNAGINKVSYIDISDAYTAVFREQVSAMALDDQVGIVTGDFVEQHHALPQSDVVTMDKVICCYHDFETLLDLALNKSRKIFAYTVPLDTWWVKMVHGIETMFKKMMNNQLITHIHPVARIEHLVLDHGFNKVYQKANMGWLTVVYSK